jgi:AcrR family transcriptional regulator
MASDLSQTLALADPLEVWTRAAPTSRRPRFTRHEIASVALRLVDAHGIDALSMRALAAELGAGTMTVYHYVRTKDELMTLVIDEALADVIIPDGEMPTTWRAAVTAIAERTRASLLRHPWYFDLSGVPTLGPNAVRHFDQSLQAVALLGVSFAEQFDIINLVDEFVFGHCLVARSNMFDVQTSPTAWLRYVEQLVDGGGFPRLAEIQRDVGLAEAWEEADERVNAADRFTRNLTLLLDGIEANVKANVKANEKASVKANVKAKRPVAATTRRPAKVPADGSARRVGTKGTSRT